MEKPMQPFYFKRIFWDVDVDKMDYTAKAKKSVLFIKFDSLRIAENQYYNC